MRQQSGAVALADTQHLGMGRTAAGGLPVALAADAVREAAFAWLCQRRQAPWTRFADQATRLYEQERQRPKGRSRRGAYVAR